MVLMSMHSLHLVCLLTFVKFYFYFTLCQDKVVHCGNEHKIQVASQMLLVEKFDFLLNKRCGINEV